MTGRCILVASVLGMLSIALALILVVPYGWCREDITVLVNPYMTQHHYAWGRLYPVALLGERHFTGWMCRYHASQWIGADPAGRLVYRNGELTDPPP